jgi:hypothetical protein
MASSSRFSKTSFATARISVARRAFLYRSAGIAAGSFGIPSMASAIPNNASGIELSQLQACVQIGDYHVGVLSSAATFVVFHDGDFARLNVPRPLPTQETWSVMTPPAEPPVSAAYRTGDEVHSAIPDRVTAMIAAGTSVFVAMRVAPVYGYIVRLTPRDNNRVEALSLPAGREGYFIKALYVSRGELVAVKSTDDQALRIPVVL